MNRRREPIAFTVSGVGQFPIDMLRHDEAYPANNSAVTAIELDTRDTLSRDSRREVRLVTHRANGPTVGRWESFNWVVVGSVNGIYDEAYANEIANQTNIPDYIRRIGG